MSRARLGACRHGWLLVLIAATLLVVLLATRFGLGISTDSVAYIAQARQLVNGEGLAVPAGVHEIYDTNVDDQRDLVPATHHPPLLPAVLAMTGAGKARDPAGPARWLNALLLTLTTLVVAVMVARHTGSCLVACLAAAAVVLSPPVLRTHAMVWSEPLFMALGVTGLLALAWYLEDPRPALLVAAALALGGAWLTRYAGIALVLTGIAALLARGPAPRGRRVGGFVLVSTLPMTFFLGGTALGGAHGSGFTVLLHRPARAAVTNGLASLRSWFIPSGTPSIPVLIACLPLAILLWLLLSRNARHGVERPPGRLSQLPWVLALFLVLYAGVLLATVSVVAEYVNLEERYFVPAYVVAVALVASVVGRGVCRRVVRAPMVLALALIMTSTAAAGAAVLSEGARGYPGFTAGVWRDSDAMKEISHLGSPVHIYSNYPEAIYIRTGRHARMLPRILLPGGRPNPRYPALLAEVVRRVRQRGGVIVLFSFAQRSHLPTPECLSNALGIRPQLLPDALVYRSAAEAGASRDVGRPVGC